MKPNETTNYIKCKRKIHELLQANSNEEQTGESSELETGQERREIRGLLHEKFRDEVTRKLIKIAGHVIE